MKYLSRLAIMLVAPLSYALAYGRDWHMMDRDHMNYGTGGFVMFLITLLALAGVVVYFVMNRNKLRQTYGDETALEILKQRYAKGEITKKQYHDMKNELG